MATRISKRKPKRYNVLAPSYKTQDQFDAAVNSRAQSQIQPQLNQIDSDTRDQTRRHTGRNEDLKRWYGFESQSALDASNAVAKSLNDLLVSNSGLQGASSDALAAALRNSLGTNAAAQAQVGGGAPAPDMSGMLSGLSAGSDIDRLGLMGQFGNLGADAARQVGIIGTGGRQAADEEYRRWIALQNELDDRRKGVVDQLPGLREQMRATLGEEERNKRAQLTQERLGNKEFGLSERAQDETERQGRAQRGLARQQFSQDKANQEHQWSVDDAQVEIARGQLENDVANAANGDAKEAAKAKAAAFNTGLSTLQGYLEPAKNEYAKSGNLMSKTWRRNRNFEDALRTVKAATGDYGVALQVLLTANIPEWRRVARQRLNYHQRTSPSNAGKGNAVPDKPGT